MFARGTSAWTPVVGGFVARIGVDLLSARRPHVGPSAVSVAFEARPMFHAQNNATGIVAPIFLTAGFEAY